MASPNPSPLSPTLSSDVAQRAQAGPSAAPRLASPVQFGGLTDAPSGLTYEATQRLSGGYEPGSMGRLTDTLAAGSDDVPDAEE